MRILIASPSLPWPLDQGSNSAQFSTLKCLAEDHQFTLVCPIFDERGVGDARELQTQLPLVEIRAVPRWANQPMLHPKANVMLRAARGCVRLGRRLINPPAPQPEMPYYPFNPLPESFLKVLDDELSKGVDLFQAELAQMLSLGTWLPTRLPKLFIHHQIHFVYTRRFLDARGRNGYLNYLEALMRFQEHAYLQNFDGLIVFSDHDRQTLLPLMQPERLFVSPFPIPADVGVACDSDATFDNRFVLVASEYFPNRDGLEWLLAEIWPEIRRKLPSSSLDVVGRCNETAKAQLAAPGVSFTGFVPDLAAALRGGIMLVPLRIGSGIRTKILASMAQGVPVVSTSIGCEGLLVTDGTDILVRDEPLQFAAAAVSLAQDPNLRLRLASAGKDSVSKHYSPQEVRRRRNEIYEAVLENARSK